MSRTAENRSSPSFHPPNQRDAIIGARLELLAKLFPERITGYGIQISIRRMESSPKEPPNTVSGSSASYFVTILPWHRRK
jgi:hypothetical protein